MKDYTVRFSKSAREDMQVLFDYIVLTCKSYKTANEYQIGLLNTINDLKKYAETFHTIKGKYSLLYGFNVRRINYKKMAIIYTVHGNIILIHRIMAGSLIL
jgi:plasmid stabilization system protein ParE